MKGILGPFVVSAAMALSACAGAPEVRPNVGERQVSPREIAPGDSVEVSFSLYVKEPQQVERIYIRGLPRNTMAAGTKVDLPLPMEQSSNYRSKIEVKTPAADGHHDLEVVIETSGKTYLAQLGALAIRDTPSRILHSQFLPGSHAAADCSLGTKTKLLTFEYAVSDDNGAADFVGPTLLPVDGGSSDLVFYPHWEPIVWLGGKPGLALEKPTEETVTEQLVTSDIRINCKMPQASLFQYEVKGQSISSLTGKSTDTNEIQARYYVK